ncbi:AAA family ATPase [Thalassotalea euphylliae]|uniref:AAA family ATPase n=1 Tax=Thalassotalea euphylliae TaxID=1655234 RepID=UPI00363F7878
MYTGFFGLGDIPFSIAPNPDFLFLGDRHKEALAHLTYGLGDTGGFVLLTGEVGTGKTTLSRRLLEQLPENTDVAFILNPTLSCLELLATICDELGVRYKKAGVTLKYLTDKIQQKLLTNQEQDRNTLLIIDEAQHLQPEVLEQLRLLTNLETNTRKLLQVVLIGQPELQQLLQRRDLRQLAQRITARYHLLPLTRNEVAEYIKHRLAVVDCHRPLFKPNAISTIHKISKGIPRLINLLCDRALANAYGKNDALVTRKTVIEASEQALGSEYHLQPWWRSRALIGASVAANLVVIAGVAFWFGSQQNTQEVLVNTAKVNATEEVQSPVVSVSQSAEGKANEETQYVGSALPPSNSELTKASVQAEPTAEPKQQIDSASPADNSQPEQLVVGHLPQSTTHSLRPQQSAGARKNDAEKPRQILSHEAAQQPTERQAATAQPQNSVTFDASQLESNSNDLLNRLQDAIEETDQIADSDYVEPEPEQPVPSLLDMPSHIQNRVPAMQFEVHIYATDGNGWVRVNGRERYEGDIVANGITLAQILPDLVILEMDGAQFSLPALSSW